MPLILVIVADPHEAAQLATLIQGRLSVDLVQAAEVGEGLLALDDRIPDLILTSPLMSPFDDGVLDEYLRDLGPAGAHVQTLRIPVLSQAPKKAKRLGFSLRRRVKPEAPTIDGCEPKVFTDEIEQYLARAAEEKRHAASNDQPVVIERQAVAAEAGSAEEQWTAAYTEDEPVASESWSQPEPDTESSAWGADLLDRPLVEETPVYQPSPVACEDRVVEYEAPIQDEPVASHDEPIALEYDQPPVAAVSASPEDVAASIDEPVVEAEPISETFAEPATLGKGLQTEEPSEPMAVPRSTAAPAMDEDKASPSFKAALAAIRAAWGKPPRKTAPFEAAPEPPAPVEPEPAAATGKTPACYEVDLTGAVEVLDEEPIDVDVRTIATPHAAADPVAEAVDVYEISVGPDLRDIESTFITADAAARKGVETASPSVADSNGDGKSAGKRAAKNAKAAKTVRQGQPQSQAAQNEWGIFDPNQCGFAALVDKLDEVADDKTKRRPQNGAKARVISLS